MYKGYLYYSKSDLNKEPIDRVLAYDYAGALDYFSNRKKISKKEFLKLYTINEPK
jgi:hypothetical protein